MTLAGLALAGTRQAYTQAVRRLAAALPALTDQLSEEEDAATCSSLRQQGAARGTFKDCGLYGLRSSYQHTLRRDWDLFREKKDRRTWAESGCLTRVGGSGPVNCSATSATRSPGPASPPCMRAACAPSAKPPGWRPASVDRAQQVLRIIGKGRQERAGAAAPTPVLDELGTVWRTHRNPPLAVPQPVGTGR